MFKVINGLTIDFQRRLIWGPTQKPMTWFQAKDLEKDNWRLPTSEELQQAFFDKVWGFTESWFWSSTPHPNHNIDYIELVSLECGDLGCDSKDIYTYYVRYVQPFDFETLKNLFNINTEIL